MPFFVHTSPTGAHTHSYNDVHTLEDGQTTWPGRNLGEAAGYRLIPRMLLPPIGHAWP